MRKFLIVLLALIGSSCKHAKWRKPKPIEIVKKATFAMLKNDINELYQIIDTSFYFEVYGKESFLQNIEFVYKRAKTSIWSYDSIMITDYEPANKMYTLTFRDTSTNNDFDWFKLNYTIQNYGTDDRILFFDIERPFKVKPIPPVHFKM